MILTWLFHAFYSTILAYLLAIVFGGLSPWIAFASLVVGTWLGFRHARRLQTNGLKLFSFTSGETGVIEWLLFVFVIYASWRHFAWMLFPVESSWATLSANNFGDLPLHINFIRAFANGIEFPPRNPIFATELLRYPFGPDLYNALWEAIGVRLQAHIFATGLFATAASMVLLRALGSWWAIGAFFLSGGMAGWQILQGARIQDFQSGIEWKNLFLSVFITQRGMLFALPAGVLLLLSTRSHFASERELDRRQMKSMGLLWGILPHFHLHSFIAVSLMMLCSAFEFGRWQGVKTFLRSRMALWAYLPATYFVLYSTDFLQRSQGIVRLQFGWTFKQGNFFDFLWMNFGPWLFVPLVIAGAIRFLVPLERRRALWFELSVYVGLFLLFFNVMLAPWEWDNIKVLIWPYLGFARLLAVCLEPYMGALLGAVERPLVACVLFLSGFIAVISTLQSPAGRATPIYQIGDLANTQGSLEKVPVNAVFAASATHQHPLTYFGRMRTLGYEGHLWSHGIDAKSIREKVDQIMAGHPDFVRLAREARVTHIFWGPDERLRYGSEPKAWMEALENVSRVPGYEIYLVK